MINKMLTFFVVFVALLLFRIFVSWQHFFPFLDKKHLLFQGYPYLVVVFGTAHTNYKTMFEKLSSIMAPWFEYESGHAWCESAYKYQTLTFVAEFANSATNLPIIILPLVNIAILWRYIREVNWMIMLPHLLLTFNGFASTYYHATLNLFGQLVDELSLVWLINMCLVVYMPVMKWYPQQYKDHMDRIRWSIVGFTTLLSGLCFIKPNLNALALMTYSVPSIFVIYYEGSNVGIPAALSTTWRIFVLWAIASTCWFSDRLLCDVWLYLGVPYLHAIFHLISSVAGYHVFVMFSLVDIQRRSNEHKFTPRVKYFPVDKAAWYTVPYITLHERNSSHIE